jgi:hypothetical protein
MSNGDLRSRKRLYLDSTVLEPELRRIHLDNRFQDDTLGESAREIPIFLFSVDYPLPVLIDKHFQSKVLRDDMVVSIQSSLHLWQSPIRCNDQPIYQNLRDPIRSILQSVAKILGGLIPLHVSHSEAINHIAEDWRWSATYSSMSYISNGLDFNQVTKDALYRSYVLSAILNACEIVNDAIERLRSTRTTSNNAIFTNINAYGHPINWDKQDNSSLNAMQLYDKRKEWNEMIQSHETFLETLNIVTLLLSHLKFDLACQQINTLKSQALEVNRSVNVCVDWSMDTECMQWKQYTARVDLTPVHTWLWNGFHWFLTFVICVSLVIQKLILSTQIKTKVN